MAIIAEAFSRGNSKTDGFRWRVVPVPKGIVRELFDEKAIDLAKAQIEDVSSVEKALRNGLALVAAEGDHEKRGKAEYARAAPALAEFQGFADRHFFGALWAQMQAQTDEARAQARLEFIRQLARAAEGEFNRALPAIPCARIMRPRAELRGYRALRGGLRRVVKDIDAGEELHVTESA